MLGTLLLVLAAVAAPSAPAPAAAAAADPGPRPCCFTNPAFVGVCTVVPTEKESCEDILAYLNAPSSAGKTYCNSTRIRGNWRNVPCPPPGPAPKDAASPVCPAAALASGLAPVEGPGPTTP
jgi:hypothetical protein